MISEHITDTGPEEAARLPLWRECAREMMAQGVEHGKVYPAAYFEKWLRCKSEAMAFTLGISEIRRLLEHEGYYLSGRGQKGEQYVILPAEAHADVMGCYSRKATDALKRGVILGTNTRLDILDGDDRRRHESMLEKMAIKFALISRSQTVARTMPKSKHGLLLKSAE